MSDHHAVLASYLATLELAERRREHSEHEGWECVPVSEVANNMAGLADEIRSIVIDELEQQLRAKVFHIEGSELWSSRAYDDMASIIKILRKPEIKIS